VPAWRGGISVQSPVTLSSHSSQEGSSAHPEKPLSRRAPKCSGQQSKSQEKSGHFDAGVGSPTTGNRRSKATLGGPSPAPRRGLRPTRAQGAGHHARLWSRVEAGQFLPTRRQEVLDIAITCEADLTKRQTSAILIAMGNANVVFERAMGIRREDVSGHQRHHARPPSLTGGSRVRSQGG
jgi:hypothetical protein